MQSLRLLRQSPGFALVAIACIALGVGVTSTMLSAVNGILVRALPYQQADRLVAIRARNEARDIHASAISWADYASWRAQNHTLADVGIWRPGFPTLTDVEAGVERVEGAEMSPGVFTMLGVSPIAGRTFLPEEEARGRDNVVVLGYGLWQRRWGGDRAIVGRAIPINGTPRIVVGIMPASFDFPERAQIWLPLAVNPATERHGGRANYVALGRLKPGVTVAEAAADLSTISRQLEKEFPQENRGWDAETLSLRDDLVGPLRRPILVLLGAAAFVLLIACANVANLMLARGEARRKELAIRVAIGAGRRQIVTQVLAETVMLALAGGAAGVFLAFFGVRLLTLAFPDGVPSYLSISVDATVLLFTLVVSVGTGLLFGLVPAIRATHVAAAHALREDGRGAAGGAGGARLRDALVSAEVALSLVLMVGATLLIRSDLSLERGLGFNPHGVLTFRVPLPSNYYDEAQRHAFYEQLAERIGALHGVTSVGSAQGLPFGPLGGSYDRAMVAIEGRPTPAPGEEPPALRQQISAGFFTTLGVPLIRGRGITIADEKTAGANVGVVNEAFARRRFPDGDPIGRRIRFLEDPAAPWITIVGVARNIRQDRPPRGIEPAVYVPFTQGSQTMAVQTGLSDPLLLAPDIRKIVRAMDPRLPTYLVQSMDQAVARALWRQRLQGQVFGIFAVLALLLAAFGIYAVISYVVARRTRELGVRMALGATRARTIGLVLAQGSRVTAIGIAIGVAAAFALSRVLSGLLYEVRPTDPATFAGVSLLLGIVALGAAVSPARRAARVDPLIAMRAE